MTIDTGRPPGRRPGSQEAPHGFVERLGLLAESRVVRACLVTLIILSVLPYPELEQSLRWVFVGAFGAELVVRVPLLWRRRRTGQAGLGALSFLLVDCAAFLSFLPLEDWFHPHFGLLVFVRLTRLLVLLRFAKDLASDLYGILTRREQLQQFGLVTVAVAAMAFVSAVILSQLRVTHDYGVPGRPAGFWDQMWWSFRQLESADNLVASLRVHPVVGVLSLVLTITGVFIISFVIGIGTNVVEQVVRAERRRGVSYHGHTVVVGPIAESEVLVREFVRIYMKNRRDFRDQLSKVWRWLVGGAPSPRAWRLPRMALLGPEPEPPPVLIEPGMRWVVYRQGDPTRASDLDRIGVSRAKRLILLGTPSAGDDADAITISTLAAVRELNPHAHVYLEVLQSRHGAVLDTLGEGTRTFPLDVPWYLGLFLLHHLVVPGVERLYELLLTAEGSEMYSHVYVQTSELDHLARLGGEDECIAFEHMAQLASAHSVVLVGVFLGERRSVTLQHDLIPMDGHVPWVNPLVSPTDPRLLELGARAGRVPAARLRGIIALGDNYQPVRDFARALARGESRAVQNEPAPVKLATPELPPRRVVVVGDGEPIVSLTQRLDELRAGAEVVVVTGHPGASAGQAGLGALTASLARAGMTLSARADEPSSAPLSAGGQLVVRSASAGQDAIDEAVRVIEEAPADALVLLPATDAKDPDARTALRLLRLAEHLLSTAQELPHVLVELSSVAKGERARDQVERAFAVHGRPPPRVTLVSTERIRNYFMVHSAFVPGINEVYAGLLGGTGHDIIKLPVHGSRALNLASARAALAARGFLLLGFERESGVVALNPKPGEGFDDVTGVYVVGQRRSLPAT